MRDRKKLIDALDITPAFLRTKEGDAGQFILQQEIPFLKSLERNRD
jgi:hypothetical protein